MGKPSPKTARTWSKAMVELLSSGEELPVNYIVAHVEPLMRPELKARSAMNGHRLKNGDNDSLMWSGARFRVTGKLRDMELAGLVELTRGYKRMIVTARLKR